MAILLGFLISLAITLTGVGGGILTAPLLILFMGVPPLEAVTVALVFAAAIKLLIAPAYLRAGRVDFRVLGKLLAGGIPGVLLGSLAIERLGAAPGSGVLPAVLGLSIAAAAAVNLRRMWRGGPPEAARRDRSRWLIPLAVGIGAEVGFSSAGAGAIGTLALLYFTTLAPAQVVATDICFGLAVSMIGGGLHWSFAHQVPPVFWPLLAGGVVGATAGIFLSTIVPPRPLRAILCLWLMAVGFELCWKSFAS